MARTFVKICGITRVEDALAAGRHGADAIGMVLHADSPRLIPPRRAKEIISVLPDTVLPIGLFVDSPVELVLEISRKLAMTHVQLYGSDSVQELSRLDALKIWRAVPVSGMLRHELQKLKAMMLLHPTTNLQALVLDTSDPHMAGGSGRPNDWAAVRAEQEQGHFARLPPLVAAGGLTHENVGEVIGLIQPWGVDVSSGVEDSEKGIKSSAKIEAFVRAVKEADAQLP